MDAINRFDEITHMPLRVYNRVAMMHNILQDSGETGLRNYLALFSDDERKQMFILNMFLKEKGQKETYKYVTKDLEFEYNIDEDEENVTIH